MFATLTKKQKEILDFIKVYSELNGYAPSLAEIKEHFKLSAISTVHEHLQNLKRKGYLHKEINQARGIRAISPNIKHTFFVEVALLGTLGIDCRLSRLQDTKTMLIPKALLENPDKCFAVTIKGVDNNNLHSGDIVICREEQNIKINDLAVFTEDGKTYALGIVTRGTLNLQVSNQLDGKEKSLKNPQKLSKIILLIRNKFI